MSIDLYFWPTPNGHKISIMLEEVGLPYRIVPVDIGKGDQFAPDFLTISPNNKMPAITDPDGPDGQPVSVFESGAILLYLAEKTGQFLPKEPRARLEVLQWLMFQMGGLGPMLGQAHHFRKYAPVTLPYAVERYTKEAQRLYKVVDTRLSKSPYLGGAAYSIADMAAFPWIAPRLWEDQGIDIGDYPHLKAWTDTLLARPAVEKGMAAGAELRQKPFTEEEKAKLFGSYATKDGAKAFGTS